tara:strand:+ start:232 stop:2946 length:2715 start_codon:yes stop_codon:yes gene_type:complete
MAENTSPTVTNVTQQRMPPEIVPYFTELLDNAQRVTGTPYQAYGGNRIAGFTNPELAAQQGIASLGMSGGPKQQGYATQGLLNAGVGMGRMATQFGNTGAQGYGNLSGLAQGYAPYQQMAQNIGNQGYVGAQRIGNQMGQLGADQLDQGAQQYATMAGLGNQAQNYSMGQAGQMSEFGGLANQAGDAAASGILTAGNQFSGIGSQALGAANLGAERATGISNNITDDLYDRYTNMSSQNNAQFQDMANMFGPGSSAARSQYGEDPMIAARRGDISGARGMSRDRVEAMLAKRAEELANTPAQQSSPQFGEPATQSNTYGLTQAQIARGQRQTQQMSATPQQQQMMQQQMQQQRQQARQSITPQMESQYATLQAKMDREKAAQRANPAIGQTFRSPEEKELLRTFSLARPTSQQLRGSPTGVPTGLARSPLLLEGPSSAVRPIQIDGSNAPTTPEERRGRMAADAQFRQRGTVGPIDYRPPVSPNLYDSARTIGTGGATRMEEIAAASAASPDMVDMDRDRYMSPYMEEVGNRQQLDAIRQGDRQIANLDSQAAQAGAFGGDRHGLMESDLRKQTRQELGNIKARSLSNAYDDAKAMFAGDREARLAGRSQQMAAQGAAEDSRRYGQGAMGEALRDRMSALGAASGTDQFAMSGLGNLLGQKLQAEGQAQSARQYGIESQSQAIRDMIASREAGLGAQMSGFGMGLGAAGQAATTGQAGYGQNIGALQAGDASRQAAGNLGMASMQGMLGAQGQADASRQFGFQGGMNALQGQYGTQQGAEAFRQGALGQQAGAYQNLAGMSGQMAGLGAQEQAMQLERLGQLENMGQRQRGLQQAGLDTGYQDFQNQRAYPKQQINWMSNILQGIPNQQVTTSSTFQQQPGLFQSALGTGVAGLGLYNSMNGKR